MFSVGLFYGSSRFLMIGSAKYFRCLIELCLETPSQKGSHAKAQSFDSITSFAPLREVCCSIIFCCDWKRVSRKGAKAQSSDSITSFAPLRLCVRFVVQSFSVVTGKGLTQRREGAEFSDTGRLCSSR